MLTHEITHDCEPTLTDRQVIQFCRDGYLELTGVVPRNVCDRVLDHFEQLDSDHPDALSDASYLLTEPWFFDGLVLNRQTAGAVRSLLGAHFALPQVMANHAGRCPEPKPLNWHIDGGNMHTFALNYLQVFCLMQDTDETMGPTEIVPGSHFLMTQSALVDHYGAIKGSRKCTGPAGTVFLTCYPIWHRRSRATATGWRHLLKYNYFRTVAPQRDWVIEPDFDPARYTNDFSITAMGAATSHRRNFLDGYHAAHMYMWLCGHEAEFKYVGGIAWPGPMAPQWDGRIERWAVPPSLRRQDKPAAYQADSPPMVRLGPA